MKFITIVIRNYCNVIDIQQVSPLFQTILTFFSQFKQERLLTSFSRLFNSLIFYEPLWELIKQQIDSFCISILLPFFVLDEEDIKDSIENPSMFLAKFQFEDVFDENPARAYIFETIQMKAKESQELCYSLYSLLVRSISANNSAQNILSIVFLFSACAKNFIKYFPQLCPNLVMLFSSFCKESNHLIKSAGLFGIKYFNMECLSIDVYYTVAMLIGDQCLLVQYYAATTFSELLENKTQKIVVMNACKDLLGNIVEMYFHLSSLFHDYEFIEMISNLLEFFGEIMTNIGVELSVEIYRTFLYYQNSFDGIEYSGVLMSSLIKFINLIKDPNEKDTIVTTLINEIFNSLQELKSGTLEIVLEFIEKLIVIAPLIHPNFWTLLNYVSSIMNNEVFILKGLKILENLVMKDPHTANVTENALQLLTLGINVLKIFSEFSNESSESIEFLARIFLFINYNDDIIIQAYNVLMPVVVKLVENPSQYNYTPSLMVSMLISHFDIFQQICGDNFWSIFGAWVENTSSVQLMTLIINTHEKFEQVDKKSRTSLIISAFKKAEVEDDIVRTAVEDEFELRLFDIHNTRVKFLEYLKTCDQQTMEEIQANINIDLEKFLTVGCPKTD